MKQILYLILPLIFFSIACQEDANPLAKQQDPTPEAQLLLCNVEYAIMTQNKGNILNSLESLEEQFSQRDSVLNSLRENKIDLFVKHFNALKKNTLKYSEQNALEELRDLKVEYSNLQYSSFDDPYISKLWQLERDMYPTTKAAIDPMLDLYEWQEFVDILNCMNESWESIKDEAPKKSTFHNDTHWYEAQIDGKKRLEKAIVNINIAANSDDYINHSLCDAGVELRESYINYIALFIFYPNEIKSSSIN